MLHIFGFDILFHVAVTEHQQWEAIKCYFQLRSFHQMVSLVLSEIKLRKK